MRDREKFLDQSRVKESAFWEREGAKTATIYNATILERENRLNQGRINEEKLRAKTQETEIVPIPEVKKDTIVSQPVAPPVEVSEKNTEVEEQVYRVQIGSFKNGVLSPSFKTLYAKISKLRKVDKFTDAKKYVVYTIGNFTSSADAVKMKDQLVQEGMKGAKVVSFNKGGEKVAKTVLPPTAKKEAAKTVAVAPASPSANTSDKSVPVGNLIFRVQISSLKNGIATPAFNKIYARISKLYKVDKYMDSRNYEIYTVGEFAGYPEATRMKNEMIQQGIKDAFIAAFHNGERIKVSEALKLAGGK
jgi:P2-related tail formation protein